MGELAPLNLGYLSQPGHLPALRNQSDLRFLLRLATSPFGEKLVHQSLLELGRQSDELLLLFDGLLHGGEKGGDAALFGKSRNGHAGQTHDIAASLQILLMPVVWL